MLRQNLLWKRESPRERIGIWGGSHGGTMVAYEVTKQPDVFHAAIELYGVVDRASHFLTTI
jgi:dipeptidyl aminopeptidase/acylaminoacyl peptidase